MVAAAAMAASSALPPARIVATPLCEARRCGEATIPRGARDSSQRVAVMKQFYRASQAGNRSLFTPSLSPARSIEGGHEEAILRRERRVKRGRGPPQREPLSHGELAGSIGVTVRRREDPRLLTGRGRYVGDVEVPRLLHVAFVRSLHAHARVREIDTAAAAAQPGITAVLTGRDPAFAGLSMRARSALPSY